MQACVCTRITLVPHICFLWNVSVCTCALSSRVDGDGCFHDVGTLVPIDASFFTSVSSGMYLCARVRCRHVWMVMVVFMTWARWCPSMSCSSHLFPLKCKCVRLRGRHVWMVMAVFMTLVRWCRATPRSSHLFPLECLCARVCVVVTCGW